jgi:class 3 adenylate cyclase
VLATAIEAYLVAGDVAHAHGLVAPAIAASGQNYTDLATTGRQLERILRAKKLDPNTLAAFTPPTIVHYVGHIIAAPGQQGRFPGGEEADIARRIGEILDGMRIGAAYGSLAAGADLLFVEALQARGIAVNIVLPFSIEDMLEQSVRPAGERWVARFQACLNAAKTVRYATEDRYLGDDHLFTYCSRLAMGLAVLFARHLHAPLRQLAVWDGEARAGVAGTVADMQAWAKAGHARTVIRCGPRQATDDLDCYVPPAVIPGRRDTRAMLFGDIQAFSKLTDAQLPIFAAQVMGAIGQVVHRFADGIAFVNTWGDGIFAVFPDAGQAACCALALQAAMRAIDFAALGLPADVRLRLGGHLGPVYELPDPILGRLNYYGVHVSRAARIEPVTPEGCVYVTETFAAVLALHNATEFACDYVGYTAMAKDYGRLRMFLLRHASADAGPTALADIERVPVGAPGTE